MFPQRKYIPDQYKEKYDFQSWEGVKVVPGLAEGGEFFQRRHLAEGALFATMLA